MCKINCKCPQENQCYEPEIATNLFETSCQNVIQRNNNGYDKCSCGFEEEYGMFPKNTMLGYAYVPRQEMDKVFTPCVGLQMGTIFPELVSPYTPCESIETNKFLGIEEMEGCKDGNC